VRDGSGSPSPDRRLATKPTVFHEALLDADSFEELPGKWQAAILEAEQNRPKLRLVLGD
jgi:hypothetical protein